MIVLIILGVSLYFIIGLAALAAVAPHLPEPDNLVDDAIEYILWPWTLYKILTRKG